MKRRIQVSNDAQEWQDFTPPFRYWRTITTLDEPHETVSPEVDTLFTPQPEKT